MQSYYDVTFKTDLNKKVKLKIRNAASNVSISTAMVGLNKMIEANVMKESYGNLAEAISLVYTEVARTPYQLNIAG